MRVDYILNTAAGALDRHGTRDPFVIALGSGAKVYLRDDFKLLKGMYSIVNGNRCIFINSNLPEHTQRIICAHELGHDALHREFAESAAFQEYTLYDMKSRPEYEANVYAAHLLLDESEIFELIREDHEVFQIAAEIGTDINLLLIKINEMNKQGFKFDLPYMPRGDFLKGE